jgi:hypothetical protein
LPNAQISILATTDQPSITAVERPHLAPVPRQRLHTTLLADVPHFEGAVFAAADDSGAVVDENNSSDSVSVPSQLEKTSMGNQIPYYDVCVGASGDCTAM